jgi:hypothetical protein
MRRTAPGDKPVPDIHLPVAKNPTLKQGDKGPDVERLQKDLNLHFNTSLTPDGDFGGYTTQAVIAVAKAGGYPQNGVMTPELWEYLLSIKPGTITNPISLLGSKINDYYSSANGYAKVKADVMGWYGTTSQGCVAFASTALRHMGVNIPKHIMFEGEDASLVTLPFSKYMQKVLKWQMITDSNLLQPGDVVLTQENNDPGYPAHTFIFSGWSNKAAGTGWIIDNQGPVHQRNIFGYAEFNMTPFAYAFRPK